MKEEMKLETPSVEPKIALVMEGYKFRTKPANLLTKLLGRLIKTEVVVTKRGKLSDLLCKTHPEDERCKK